MGTKEGRGGLLPLISKLLVLVVLLAILGITIAGLAIVVSVKNSQNDIKSFISTLPNNSASPQSRSSLNIPQNPAVSATDGQKYSAYQQALAEFKYSVDFTADPCNDFYKYACGNYKKAVSLRDMTVNNYRNMMDQLLSPAYQPTINNSTALQKEQIFFNACVASLSDPAKDNQTLVANNYLKNKVDTLKKNIGSPFTTVFGGNTTAPTPTQLANALGYLSFQLNIDTYVTPYVDTYWKDNTKNNLLFIDQNMAEMDKTYYKPNVFPSIVDGYVDQTTATLMQFCIEQNQTCPGLRDKVAELINFEQLIAYNYSTDDNTRRQAERSWNLTTVNNLIQRYTFVDWNAYFKMLPDVAQPVVNTSGFQVDVMEDQMMFALSTNFKNFKSDNVVNYLYMRLIIDSAQYLPTYKNVTVQKSQATRRPKLGKIRSERRQKRRRMDFSDAVTPNGYTDAQYNCISLTDQLMQYANGRVFIDKVYPDDASRKAINTVAGGLIHNIINSFQGMLEQLDWMTDPTKTEALKKTQGIIENIAFPSWIADNTQLDNYYQTLNLSDPKLTFYDMWDQLIKYNLFLQYKTMTAPADRHDFQAGPAVVDAWYNPEYNSMTLAAGMLQPPFFHQNFPNSLNYGGIGIVSGHELTHGFDDQGVQWGPTGNLLPWMDNDSSAGFNNMTYCVINEYNNFCPLNPQQYTPNCINGIQTQGENIADNGGIHAAFRAYRTHIQLDGPDPTLPDPVFGQFTHDQLFFLNYGQIWCEAPVSDADTYQQLMTDPHSPALYRVFGTILNFPAFRVAYNCPVGSMYAPQDHCRVWVPNFEA